MQRLELLLGIVLYVLAVRLVQPDSDNIPKVKCMHGTVSQIAKCMNCEKY